MMRQHLFLYRCALVLSVASAFQPQPLNHELPTALYASTDSGSKSNVQTSTTKWNVPTPPWKFAANGIFYQFQAIPVDQARRFCPPCAENDAGVTQNLKLLSFNEKTLGGVFVIEYKDSPIGPYREVAVLSSLVARWSPPSQWLPAIGAWASHIFVDSQDAADYGREFWGLPATVVPIQFLSHHSSQLNDEANAGSIQFTADNEIIVSGWPVAVTDKTQTQSLSSSQGLLNQARISLPSFSGLLPSTGDSQEAYQQSPLLQYPLTIESPSSVNVAPVKAIQFDEHENGGNGKVVSQISQVKALLDYSLPMSAVQVGPVNLVAGVPTIVGGE